MYMCVLGGGGGAKSSTSIVSPDTTYNITNQLSILSGQNFERESIILNAF